MPTKQNACRPQLEALEDRTLLAVSLVSVNAAGTVAANLGAGRASDQMTSGDGRAVVFVSLSTDLVAGQSDANNSLDVFVRDLQAGVTTLVSHSTAGPNVAGNAGALFPVISGSGRFVAFESPATNLLAGFIDHNATNSDVYLLDRQTGSLSLLSHRAGSATDGSNGDNHVLAISDSGQFILFESDATDLVPGFVNNNAGQQDLFLYDTTTNVARLVSHAAGSPTAGANAGRVAEVVMSADGRFVAYCSEATNLVSGFTDGNGASLGDIFLFDRQTGATVLVSHAVSSTTRGGNGVSLDAAISANGAVVAFDSSATDLVGGFSDHNGGNDVFRYDVASGTLTLASVSTAGGGNSGNGGSDNPTLSADGSVVSFLSFATDLVAGVADGNAATDVFVRSAGQTHLVSVNASGTATGNNQPSTFISSLVSPDGRLVAFTCTATDLVAGVADGNRIVDVFVRDLVLGSTRVASTVPAGTQTGNAGSNVVGFAGNGQLILFSDASDLTPLDSNGKSDLFAFDLSPPPPPPPSPPPPPPTPPPPAAFTARAARRRGKSVVLVFDAATGRLRQTLVPFRGFAGRLQLALTDLNGDSFRDLLVSARVHGKRRRKAFNALDLSPLPVAPA